MNMAVLLSNQRFARLLCSHGSQEEMDEIEKPSNVKDTSRLQQG